MRSALPIPLELSLWPNDAMQAKWEVALSISFPFLPLMSIDMSLHMCIAWYSRAKEASITQLMKHDL